MRLIAQVYEVTREFPADEKSGMAAALRRAVTALPGKLLEAWQVSTVPVEADHAPTAQQKAASQCLADVLTQLLISKQLGFISGWSLRRYRKRITHIDALIIKQLTPPILEPELEANEDADAQADESAPGVDADDSLDCGDTSAVVLRKHRRAA